MNIKISIRKIDVILKINIVFTIKIVNCDFKKILELLSYPGI